MRPLQCLMRRRLTDTGFTGPIAFKAGRPTLIQLVNLPVGFQRNVVMLAYGLRIRRLFVETEPQFADYEEERHLRSVDWRPLPAGESLDMILAEHRQLAALLSTLPDEAWNRVGYHPESGALTIEFLAQRIIEHANEHQQQIAETLHVLSA